MHLEKSFIQEIVGIWKAAQGRAFSLVNREMIEAYWEIGRRIVEEEQKGLKKAQYGDHLIKELSRTLSQELDKSLGERELRKIRQFYICFPIRAALRPELTFSHYKALMRVEDEGARTYYLNEAADQAWGTRLLERNIQTLYYARILTSRGRSEHSRIGPANSITPADLIKDTYIMEFLGLDVPAGFSENELETAILGKLQQFLLELGKGFAFVGRQYAIKTDTKIYYIDLVFYNVLLKFYCILDLKIGQLTHQDIGQMDMYVRMFEDLRKIPGDNPTMGIILCSERDETLVKYSILDGNEHLFASRYRLFLPTEEELSREIEREKQLLNQRK